MTMFRARTTQLVTLGYVAVIAFLLYLTLR